MVSIPDGFTVNSPMSHGLYATVKKSSARKPLHQFTELLCVKQKAAIRSLVAAKLKRKAIRKFSMLYH